jgi:hypothetical protein
MDDSEKPDKRKASIGATFKTVLSSFIGLRNKSANEKDVGPLNPVHLIIAAIICALIFITILLVIVKNVVAK